MEGDSTTPTDSGSVTPQNGAGETPPVFQAAGITIEGTQAENSNPTSEPRVKEPGLDPLRTYQEDIREAIQDQHASIVSITAAEEERKAAREKAAGAALGAVRNINWKKLGVWVVSVGFILLGIGVAGGVYYFYLRPLPPEAPRALPVMSTEEEVLVPVESLSGVKLLEQLTAKKDGVLLRIGSVAELNVVVDEASKTPLTAQNFLSSIEGGATNIFIRSLDSSFFVGSHVFAGNQAFFLFRVAQFESAFRGMLEWEDSISRDLSPLFGKPVLSYAATATTPAFFATFSDRVIENKDTRVLTDDKGAIKLLYSFPDRATLIIATNEHTFIEVLRRLSNARVFR